MEVHPIGQDVEQRHQEKHSEGHLRNNQCQKEREQVRGGSPFTMPVQVVQALHEALLEFEEAGGWQSRRQLYRSRSDAVRDLLHDVGVDLIVPRDSCASTTDRAT